MTAWLSDAARRALEEFMSLHGYEFQSEFAKKYAAEGRKEGLDEGRKEVLIMAIEGFTELLGIALSSEQRETLEKAGVERLETIFQALRSTRQWPGA